MHRMFKAECGAQLLVEIDITPHLYAYNIKIRVTGASACEEGVYLLNQSIPIMDSQFQRDVAEHISKFTNCFLATYGIFKGVTFKLTNGRKKICNRYGPVSKEGVAQAIELNVALLDDFLKNDAYCVVS